MQMTTQQKQKRCFVLAVLGLIFPSVRFDLPRFDEAAGPTGEKRY